MNIDKNRVSIVVPAYNASKTLNRCIDSIINQVHERIEIVLIDDGSIDSTGNLCDSYALRDSRIIVLHKKNEGVGAARNDGVNICSGRFICFCDSDDCVSQFWARELCSGFDDDIHYVICGFQQGQRDIVSGDFHSTWKRLDKSDIADLYFSGLLNAVWNKSYEKSVIIENSVHFNTDKNGEDLCFNIDYVRHLDGYIAYTDAKLYNYLENEASVTSGYIPRMWDESMRRMRKTRNLFVELGIMTADIEMRLMSIYSELVIRCINSCIAKPASLCDVYKEVDCIVKSDEYTTVLKYLEAASWLHRSTKLILLSRSSILIIAHFKLLHCCHRRGNN